MSVVPGNHPDGPLRRKNYFSDINFSRIGRIQTPQKPTLNHQRICEFFTLELLSQGEFTLLFNNRRLPLKAPSVFWLSPGDVFDFRPPWEPNNFEHCWINMTGKRARRIHEALNQLSPQDPYLVLPHSGRLPELFLSALNDFLAAPKARHEAIAVYVETIMEQIYRIFTPAAGGFREDHQIRRIAMQIHDYPERPWDIRKLAVVNGMSYSNFRIRFRKTMELSVYAYIREQRLNRAYQLLDSGELLKEVAQQCGFSSPLALSRAWRLKYGLSPQKYIHEKNTTR